MSEPTPPRAGALASRTRAAAALAHVERVLALDDVWTSHLVRARSGRASDPELGDLRVLALQIDEALAQVPDAANDVEAALASEDDERVEEALQAIVSRGPRVRPPLAQRVASARRVLSGRGEKLAPRLVAALQVLLGRSPDVLQPLRRLAHGAEEKASSREALLFACRFVRDETEQERNHLRGKIDLLEAGQVPDPDLRPKFKCGLKLLGIGAGTAATIGSGGATELLGLGVAGQVVGLVADWEGSGCPETWRTIKRQFARS